ncbi:MAG: glycosyltransferase, partial [bacterium]|nr:glycosyltransferase [bacterium]
MQSKRIKICYVASVDITLRFILLNHMKFLKAQGYDISAVCSQGKWLEDVRKEGIKVKTIELKRKISPLSDLIAFFKLYFYFKKEKFDIVHTHTPKPEVYGQIAAKLAGVPIIIDTLHGFDLPADISLFGRKIFFFLKKVAARYSDLIFSVNKKNIETLVNEKICSPSIIKYFGNGIDTRRFDSSRFSEEFITRKKSEIGISPQKKVVGIVARMVEEKGYLDLFNAFKLILEKFPDTILLVVGPLEPEKKDAITPAIIKNYGIEKNIVFLGERADVDEIYPLMDVFVLPSHREGLPYTILEASSTGKPVVATDVGGCPEAVDDKKTGLLVSPRKPEALAEAITYLFSHPEQAQAMGREGRKKVLAEFDEKIVFQRIKTEYVRLFAQKVGFKHKVCCVVSVDITLKFMLLSQLKFLQRSGYEVFAICSPGKWVQDIRSQGIQVKTMTIKRKMSPVSDFIFFWKMYFYFKKEKFDIVHTHTPKPEVYGQIAAKLAGVPIIIDTL